MAVHNDDNKNYSRTSIQAIENMTGQLSKNFFFSTRMIFFSALFFSLLVLNRWIVSDLGLLSYGRVWQLYISYSDFGFFRRGFIGTLFSETGLNSLFSNEYIFAFFIHHVALIVLALLTAFYCIKKNLVNPVFIVGIAFSPALLIHSGYTTGALDAFVLLFALINILYARTVFLFSVVLVAGIFTHELFIFTLPAQFWAFYFCNKTETKNLLGRVDYIPIVLAILAICIVVFWGRTEVPELEFKDAMRMQIPNAFEKHSFWSGYLEVGSSIERNMDLANNSFSILKSGKVFFIALPLLYVVLLTIRIWEFSSDRVESVFLTAAICAPWLISLVATDLHRWVAMSANMAILLTLRLAARDGVTASKWNIPIVLFCFLGPFGGAELERPFPLHQFVIEKITTDWMTDEG